MAGVIRLGTAGWGIPAALRESFPGAGSLLERYGARMNAVEINSSFYRPHRRQTYERWAASVPEDFRFAVKLPRRITHEQRLRDFETPLARFLDEISGLGAKLGVILVQLPPALAFDADAAAALFAALRHHSIACEPRHASWFTPEAEALMIAQDVARVAADPPRHAADGAPGGAPHLAYWRWHGSPRIYWSAYDDARLRGLAAAMTVHPARDIWCIFDNTAAGAALDDALRLRAMLSAGSRESGTNRAGTPYYPAKQEEPHGPEIFQGRLEEGRARHA